MLIAMRCRVFSDYIEDMVCVVELDRTTIHRLLSRIQLADTIRYDYVGFTSIRFDADATLGSSDDIIFDINSDQIQCLSSGKTGKFIGLHHLPEDWEDSEYDTFYYLSVNEYGAYWTGKFDYDDTDWETAIISKEELEDMLKEL